jgi:hypothetical protein
MKSAPSELKWSSGKLLHFFVLGIPTKRYRKDPICFSPYLYRARN